MRRITLAAVGLLAMSGPACACINEIGTTHQGLVFEPPFPVGIMFRAHLLDNRDHAAFLAHARRIVGDARRQPDLRSLTDLAILLIHLGKHDIAIRLLQAIERKYPGHFETAGNIGTAYELAGNDAEALHWIRIGIRRNPNEHFGSEWLHVRILEAKIAHAGHPGDLARESILGLDFEDRLVPAMPTVMPAGNDGKPLAPWQVDQALQYQLHERMGFVKPPDPVVANLLSDWATLHLSGGALENADVLYQLAFRYGAPATPQLKQRQRFIADRLAHDKGNRRYGSCALCWQPPPPSHVPPPGASPPARP